MKVISGTPRSGKTTEMILRFLRAKKDGEKAIIIAKDKNAKNFLYDEILHVLQNNPHLEIPVELEDIVIFKPHNEVLDGLSKRDIYIDNVDEILKSFFPRHEIKWIVVAEDDNEECEAEALGSFEDPPWLEK